MQTPDTITAVDLILTLAAVAAVALAVSLPSRRTQVGAFLSLGVILSLIWLRLGSLDVAFAEASLGTGLLSALLVWLVVEPRTHPDARRTSRGSAWFTGAAAVLVGALITLGVTAAFLRTDQRLPAWTAAVDAELPAAGLEHDVSAVLLAFRGYDTLLESAVLLLAGVVVLSLSRDGGLNQASDPQPELPSILNYFTRLTAPLLLLLGLWLLFAGSSTSGGAFQSGAILAGLMILLRTAGVNVAAFTRTWGLPLLVVGVIVFILAGAIAPLAGEAWLSWDMDAAFAVILTVEVLLTIGITTGLYALYLGLSDPGRRIREDATS
ncbi:Na+/H+ antiporter MnhB-like protein [Corynebacterium maris DSM 45190]|uniref:Na+/H+ antiporter MnhB-like protein n=2 Tax=Corynebacterium TaxID=1716 RepID=S5SXQ3_9CORY|nr:Na+/H+ antiporter MnhB-like protein [Corynebacterium maris DSM 45190]